MHFNFVIIVNLLKLLLHSAFCIDENLKFKIALPEFICDKNGSVREVNKDMTTIRLLGKDAVALDYKFDVNFKRIGSDCRNNQRCNLIIWKAVRELDKFLKDYPVEEKQTGLIQIKNTMLLPGIQYVLNVTIINDGQTIEEKQLTLDYVDNDVKKLVEKPMASVLLLGSDTAYAYMTYIINAEITICSNISGYYFNWELFDDSMASIEIFPWKGAELTVQPNTFQAFKSYTITCDLIDMEKNNSVANGLQTVNILSKGLLLNLPFKKITAEINQPLDIKAFIKDLDNNDGDLEVKFSCVSSNNNDCDYKSDTSESEMELTFPSEGNYKLTFEISKNNFKEIASCEIEVRQNVPTIEIDETPSPVSPSTGIQITAYIYKLRTSCTMQWTSVKQENYEFLDLNTVPGQVNELITVTLKEDLFLHELEEFSNGTVDKEHDLNIPPPQDSWPGLKGDTRYMFRLNITCPPITEEVGGNETDVELLLEPPLTLLGDVAIETNAAPVVSPLEVSPLEGLAFATTFNFKTLKAQDRPEDGPILYKFGYVLDNRDVIDWSLCDVTNAESILPYSEGGIQTILIVCDNFESCNRINGPLIKTSLSKDITKAYNEDVIKIFVEKMNSEEYNKAFSFALSLLYSYKSIDNKDIYNEAYSLICDRINSEIQKWIDYEVNDATAKTANNLIKNINEFNKDMKFSEAILNDLLKLRNKLSDEIPEKSQNYVRSQRKLLSSNTDERFKRNDFLSLEDVRGYIEVSELVITTSTDLNTVKEEKLNLRNQIHNYMEKLCVALYKKTQTIQLEFKTLLISVEKLNRNSFNNYIIVPFEPNSWQISARIKLTPNKLINEGIKNKLCIGKVILQDYFESKGFSYMAEILNGESSKINEINNIIVIVPVNQSRNEMTEVKCMVYFEGWKSGCKLLKRTGKYMKCSCNYLGYYLLEYQKQAVSATNLLTTTSSSLNLTEKSQDFGTTIINNPTKTVPDDDETAESINVSSSSPELANIMKTYENNYEIISYVVIVASVIGIVILCFILRKISSDNDDNNDEALDNLDLPKYAQLHNEEMLCDSHI